MKDPGGLLYFTDGNGIYPKKQPPYKTAFLFLGDYDKEKVPAWAMQLAIEKEELRYAGESLNKYCLKSQNVLSSSIYKDKEKRESI